MAHNRETHEKRKKSIKQKYELICKELQRNLRIADAIEKGHKLELKLVEGEIKLYGFGNKKELLYQTTAPNSRLSDLRKCTDTIMGIIGEYNRIAERVITISFQYPKNKQQSRACLKNNSKKSAHLT